MAVLNNNIIDGLMNQVKQPFNFGAQQQVQGQMPQQVQPLQPYKHSYDSTNVMRGGTQYNGTHTMQFGNSNTAQSLGSGLAKNPQYSAPQVQQNVQQPMQQQGLRGGSAPFTLDSLNNTLNGMSGRIDNAYQDVMRNVVTPVANNRNAMGLLTLAMDYNNKQQAMDDQRSYQNGVLKNQQEANRFGAIESQAKANYYNGYGKGGTGSTTAKDNTKLMEMRNKDIETVIAKAPDWDNLEANIQGMIREEYRRSGRLPHRYYTDGGGVRRPVYYKSHESQYEDNTTQQQALNQQQKPIQQNKTNKPKGLYYSLGE